MKTILSFKRILIGLALGLSFNLVNSQESEGNENGESQQNSKNWIQEFSDFQVKKTLDFHAFTYMLGTARLNGGSIPTVLKVDPFGNKSVFITGKKHRTVVDFYIDDLGSVYIETKQLDVSNPSSSDKVFIAKHNSQGELTQEKLIANGDFDFLHKFISKSASREENGGLITVGEEHFDGRKSNIKTIILNSDLSKKEVLHIATADKKINITATKIDDKGNLYIAGHTYGTYIEFAGGLKVANSNKFKSNFFVAKYSLELKKTLWVKGAKGDNMAFVTEMALNSSGDTLFLLGNTTMSKTLTLENKSISSISGNFNFLASLSSSKGNLGWLKMIDMSNYKNTSHGKSLIVVNDNIYLTVVSNHNHKNPLKALPVASSNIDPNAECFIVLKENPLLALDAGNPKNVLSSVYKYKLHTWKIPPLNKLAILKPTKHNWILTYAPKDASASASRDLDLTKDVNFIIKKSNTELKGYSIGMFGKINPIKKIVYIGAAKPLVEGAVIEMRIQQPKDNIPRGEEVWDFVKKEDLEKNVFRPSSDIFLFTYSATSGKRKGVKRLGLNKVNERNVSITSDKQGNLFISGECRDNFQGVINKISTNKKASSSYATSFLEKFSIQDLTNIPEGAKEKSAVDKARQYSNRDRRIQKENNFNTSISVYPNPTDGLININFKNIFNESKGENYAVDVISITGSILLSKKFSNNTQLDISGLPSAIYTLRIVDTSQNLTKTIKIIKN